MKYLCFLVTYLSISSAAPSLEANSRDHRRIIGGDEVDIKHFPYIGTILVGGQQGCGAVLIRNDTLLSAAHCFEDYDITDLSVRLGSSQRSSGGQVIRVKQVIIHEKYYHWEYPTFAIDYDIAVLKLNESVNNANAATIGLAAQGTQYKDGTPGVVAGWGITETEIDPETLRAVEVPVYDQTQCEDVYSRTNKRITNTMICAGYKEGYKGACSGDSGGPYVIKDELVGIVSWGEHCLPGFPGVYTSVPALHDWIEHHA